MPNEPEIKILSQHRRERFFWVLVIIFLITLPTLIFYTTGYRLSFQDEQTTIVSTGGMYINTEDLDVEVYLDEALIEQPRLFRSAYYIQNLSAGQHRVVVQRPNLQTWVKELPVYAHIVTEAAAFNLPRTPHVRPITRYLTATGTPVVYGVASGTDAFPDATSTVPVLIASTSATSTFERNEEFGYVQSLFSTTSTSTRSVFERFVDELERFRFATTTTATSAPTTTQPIRRGNTELITQKGELYARWVGSVSSIPYYYCVAIDASASSTAARYGEHVAEAFTRSLPLPQVKSLSTAIGVVAPKSNSIACAKTSFTTTFSRTVRIWLYYSWRTVCT